MRPMRVCLMSARPVMMKDLRLFTYVTLQSLERISRVSVASQWVASVLVEAVRKPRVHDRVERTGGADR